MIKAFHTFNDWLARHTVSAMSSMICVYVFVAWSVLPSVDSRWEQLVFYVSGGVIQLVALPLIMVGQKLEARENDRRSKQDHEMLKHIIKHVEHLR